MTTTDTPDNRRWLAGAASVLVIGAGIVAVTMFDDNDPDQVRTVTDPEQTDVVTTIAENPSSTSPTTDAENEAVLPSPTPTTTTDISSSTAPTTTTAPTSTTSSTAPTNPAETNLRLDGGGALFGVSLLEIVDDETQVQTISSVLGTPTGATDWMVMPEPLANVGVEEYREVRWNDLRVVFERTDGETQLSGWSLGAAPPNGCFPAPTAEPTGDSGLMTEDGIGIGSTIDALVDRYDVVNQSDDGATIVAVNPISILFADDVISGISQARADCFSDEGL